MIESMLQSLAQASHAGTLKRYDKMNLKQPYYGVPMGAISRLAKEFRGHGEAFQALWQTGNLEAQLLAIQLVKPNEVSQESLMACLDPEANEIVMDKLVDKILAKRTDKDFFQEHFFQQTSDIEGRMAWGLLLRKVMAKEYSIEEVNQHLDLIEVSLQGAPPLTQWNMNRAMVEIALAYPSTMDRVLEMSHRLGVYADMKVSKGCTSAYAPEWIGAILKKK